MQRFGMFAIIGGAYRQLWADRRDLFLLGYLPVLISALALSLPMALFHDTANAMLGAVYATGRLPPDLPPGRVESMFLAGLAAIAVVVALGIVFAVAWFRRILLPDERSTVAAALRWRRRQWRFLWRCVQLTAITLGVGVIMAIPLTTIVMPAVVPAAIEGGRVAVVMFLLSLIMNLVLAAILIRFTMVLPAAAVDAPCGLGPSWRMTRGHTFALVVIVVAVSVPLWVVQGTFEYGLSAAFAGEYGLSAAFAGATAMVTLPLVFAVVLVQMILGYVGWALGISALALVWKRLAAAPAVPAGNSPAAA